MAFKAVVLLACVLVARSQKICSVDDLPGEAISTQLAQIAELYARDWISSNGWVSREVNNSIMFTTEDVLAQAEVHTPLWNDSIQCAEDSPVTKSDLQGCSDPRPTLQQATKRLHEEIQNCLNSNAKDLRDSTASYTVDTTPAQRLIDQARQVASTCQCRSDCLADLMPIVTQAAQLAQDVPTLYNSVAAHIRDFTYNSLVCARTEYVHRQRQFSRALANETRCIEKNL